MTGPRHKVCFQFIQHGQCKYGDSCIFSHNPSGEPRTPTEVAHLGSQPGGQGKSREWNQLLRRGQTAVRIPAADVARFFHLALEIVDGDLGGAQDLVKSLATESGISYIKKVSDRPMPTVDDQPSCARFWESELRPLFQLITHHRVTGSNLLEQEVATIYNFLNGVGGERMQQLFTFVGAYASTANAESPIATVNLALTVISKMMECNSLFKMHGTLPTIITQLSTQLNNPPLEADTFAHAQAVRHLEYIQLRLQAADEIKELKSQHQPAVHREQFILRKDLPGRLSADGPRHDNDHASIVDIKILPTTEEIMSVRQEYLPTNDPSTWHIREILGRLDREFRLLREDTVGQLRNSVRDTIDHIRTSSAAQKWRTSRGARTYSYELPVLEYVTSGPFNGLELTVSCKQPRAVRGLTVRARRDWWMQSKRLQAGALLCIVDATPSVIFLVVADSTIRAKDGQPAKWNTPTRGSDTATADPDIRTLSEHEDSLFVRLQLADPTDDNVRQVLHWYRGGKLQSGRYLVEFPGVLLASFTHTLAALQKMYKEPNIPFSRMLAPSRRDEESFVMGLPLYCKKPGFTFDLRCLTTDRAPLVVSPGNPPRAEELESRSTLDLTQSNALLNTLTSELSIIQGPPGTGKSYTGEKIIQVLLSQRKDANLGPIICVCYTNHALDQLLEHLIDDGVKGIIRMGSRSKSERLQDLALRNVAKSIDRTRSEKSEIWRARQNKDEIATEIKTKLDNLGRCHSTKSIKEYLERYFPSHFRQLFREDEIDDDWQTVKVREDRIIPGWLREGSRSTAYPRQLHELENVSIFSTSSAERLMLHQYWLKDIKDEITDELLLLHGRYQEAQRQQDQIHGEIDLRCLQTSNVIGVTTTGLARQLNILRKLRCKTMLCEEAGEVLEAHILTALLPSLEHVILIGDHLQLRPQIQNYDLQFANLAGRQYSLDMSLFERLVQPPYPNDIKIPFSVLETQRRMHPSIAELVRSTLYPSLKDHDNVSHYPNVTGMKKRLFWFHHGEHEDNTVAQEAINTSHSNKFEIEMTAALVSHLVRQGEYVQGDIAVITPYLGQLHKLRKRMETMFEIAVNERDLEDLEGLEEDLATQKPTTANSTNGTSLTRKTTLLKSVRVATVDNFQGEEAKVIVLSLVRSNAQNKCGFLSTSNRINVLLSRAQHGMYLIGNADTYRSVPMWAQVLGILGTHGNVGNRLELQCARHPSTPIYISQPDHFMQYAPESGCTLPCDKRLDCGHSCPGRCHSDVLHGAVKCLEDCLRLKKGCVHPCPRPCGEDCYDRCLFQLHDINLSLPCGHHLTSAKCWQAQSPSSVRCTVQVTRTVPGCSHQVQVLCCDSVTGVKYQCNATCSRRLDCGHSCRSSCFQCVTRTGSEIVREVHAICKQTCGRKLTTCRHNCSRPCHDGKDCPPCIEPCDTRCGHSRCAKPCNEPCAPCAEEKCDSSCPHSSCDMPCAAPCNWVPCSQRCSKMLTCGHQCPSLCGESCPDAAFCQQCASSGIKETCVDFIEGKSYQEVNLDEEPCIFPDCGHFLAISSMDGQMEMATHYTLNAEGTPTQLRGSSEPFSTGRTIIAVCASCRGSLRNIGRYGRIVRRVMLDDATKRFISWGHLKYLECAEMLIAEREKLEAASLTVPTRSEGGSTGGSLILAGSRLKQLEALRGLVGRQRYDGMINLWRKISSYRLKVDAEEQPFQRVADFVKGVNQRHKSLHEFHFDDSVIQVKGFLQATAMLLQCETAIFFDLFRLRRDGKIRLDGHVDLKKHLQECQTLLELAHTSQYPKEVVQGNILSAQFYALSISFSSPQRSWTGAASIAAEDQASDSNDLREKGLGHVRQAREWLEKYPSASALKNDVDAVEDMLSDGEYRPVTADELRAVYAALSGELRGTGHWYTCANGHPFTVGECGMPMERARCPECDAPVGGQNHTAAEGVRHATEIEDLVTGIRGLAV